MDVSSQDPSLLVMDLSKGFSAPPMITRHTEAKKPEWYHRRPPSSEISSSYRPRPSSSYTSLEPGPPVLCRDMDQSSEPLGNYMNSTLTPRLDLYRVDGAGRVGVHGSLWHPGYYGPDQTGGPGPESSGGEESDSGSDVIFLVSSSKEPLLCSPFIQDGVGHIVEPLSPAVSSLEEGRSCYHLPQPLSSPSPDSSYSDESSDSSVDIPVHHTRPVVLLSDLSSAFRNHPESGGEPSSDDSDVIEVSVSDEKRKKTTVSKDSKTETKKAPHRKVRRSSRITKSSPEPPATPSSTRRSNLSRRAKRDAVGIYNESGDSDDILEYAARVSSSDEEEKLPEPEEPEKESSNSEQSEEDRKTDRKTVQRQTQRRLSKSSSRKRKTTLTAHRTEKIRRAEQKESIVKAENQNDESTVKKKPAVRRRRKRPSKTRASPRVFPTEPEIKLRHANVEEKKKREKEKLSGYFSPFVHIEKRRCIVINFQREAETMRSRGLEQNSSRSLSGFVPKSSCFQLGRSGSDSSSQTTLRCCLCGQTANTMGLGDLHGPYVPSTILVDCQNQDQEESKATAGEQKEGLCGLLNGSLEKPPSVQTLDSSLSPHLDECWIHEDCGIWSAGIFLVQGKLYGLQEAAQLAQKTECTSCKQTGAIMGCFQKGCQSNYHYRCAIQSGCVLNEENFSVLCPEHKNRLFSTVTRRHRR